jgi:prevent-host-death family protein
MEINAKEARSRLSALLDKVEQGSEITIVRRGKKVARLVPAEGTGKMLPGLRDFRATIRLKGEKLSEVVIRGREEVRY